MIVINVNGICEILFGKSRTVINIRHLPLYGKWMIGSRVRIFQCILDHLIRHKKRNDGINCLHLVLYGIIDLI